MNLHNFITDYKTGFCAVINGLDTDQVGRVADALDNAFKAGKRIFVAGNGGSAATASHMACDLAKTTLGKSTTLPVQRIKAIALTDNMPLITAWGNDVSYDLVFAEQLRNLAEDGDLLLVISASGNSPNVIEAIGAAKELHMHTIGLLGFDGGKAAPLCDLVVIVRSTHFGFIEDAHSVIGHLVTDHLKQAVQRLGA